MSLLPFCVCKACRKWETRVSTIGRQEKEAGETNFFAQARQRALQNALNLSRTIGRMLSERRGKVVFSCEARALYLIPPRHWGLRQSDRGVARMSFSCKCVKDPLYPQNVLSVCAFSFCSTPPPLPTYSQTLIHCSVRLADSIQSRGTSATVSWPRTRFEPANTFAVLQGHL